MRRRTVLAAVATASMAFAGCVAGKSKNNPSAGSETDDGCSVQTRNGPEQPAGALGPTCPREPTVIGCQGGPRDSTECETAEPVAYLEPPTAFTDSALVAYVERFERACRSHEAICDARESSSQVTNASVSIHRTESLDLYEDRTAVFLLRSGRARWPTRRPGRGRRAPRRRGLSCAPSRPLARTGSRSTRRCETVSHMTRRRWTPTRLQHALQTRSSVASGS